MKLFYRAALVAAAVVVTQASMLRAQTLTWDGDLTTPGIQNGIGTWDTTAIDRWYNSGATVPGYQAWSNSGSEIAQFGALNSGVGAAISLNGATIKAAGINFLPLSGTVSPQYSINTGTLAFSDNAIINSGDNSSTGSLFTAFSSALLITGNGLTIQRSNAVSTVTQFLRFDMVSNPGLQGELVIKGTGSGLFVRSASPTTFGAMSLITIEANSTLSILGSGNYAVPIRMAGTGGSNQYGAIRVDASSLNITGGIALTGDAAIQTNLGATNISVTAPITGAFAFQRFATGTGAVNFTMASANTYTGTTTLGRTGSFSGGQTTLDFSAATAPLSDILYSGAATPGALSIIGGPIATTSLLLTGKAAVANTQRIGAVTFSGTRGTISLTSGAGGSMTLDMGAFSRTGATLASFTGPASGSINTTRPDGVPGGWATYVSSQGITTLAQVSGGKVVAFTGDTDHVTGVPVASGVANLRVNDSSTGLVTLGGGATTDVNTISMVDDSLARTVAVANGAILRLGVDGGIVIATGAKSLTIGETAVGSTLTAGGTALNVAGQIAFTNGSPTSTLTVNSSIKNNNTGIVSVAVSGTGPTVFSASNTYTGGTIIATGSLEITNSGALGTSGAVSVHEGASLRLSGNINLARPLAISGTGVAADGVIRNLSGNNTVSGLITQTLIATRIMSDSGTLTLSLAGGTAASNIVSGTLGLTFGGKGDIVVANRLNLSTLTLAKDGPGMLVLNGDSNYTGTTTINGGVVRLGNAVALSTSVVTINENLTDGAALELSGGINVANSITFNGGGVGSLGALRNRSGDNTLSGILSIGLLASNPRITADAGTSLTISGTLRTGASAVGTRTVILGGAGTMHVTGSITNGTTVTWLTGINKVDSGTVNLRAANTYTAPTVISGGTLNLDFANATPTTTLIPTGNALTLGGGTLLLTGKDATSNSQSIISTTLSAGRSAITVTAGATGGSSSLALGVITRAASAGSVVNLTLPTTGAITTPTLNTSGTINGAMTVDKVTWATSAATATASVAWANAGDTISIGSLTAGSQVVFTGTAPAGLTANIAYYVINPTASNFQVSATLGGTAIAITNDGTTAAVNREGAITGLSSTAYSSTLATGTNVDVTGGAVSSPAITVNSLRFNAAAGTTLSMSGDLTNSSGGILMTSNVTSDVTIQSNNATVRTLSNTSTTNDFLLHQHSTTASLIIGPTITVTNAAAFTKTGAGNVTFAGTTATSAIAVRVFEGTLTINGTNRFTTGSTDPSLLIGSATTSGKVVFGNGATAGAEVFTTINTGSSTGSSLVGGGSGIYNITMQSGSTSDLRNLRIGGDLANENNISIDAFTGALVQMGSTNSYVGKTNIGRSTFEVSLLANAGSDSSLGRGTSSPTIDMNDTNSTAAVVSTLRYLGATDSTTDRAVRLMTDGNTAPSLTGVLENNGVGSVKFTSAFTASGTSTLQRLLRLTGTNTGGNEIVSISDNGVIAVVALEKTGVGTWALTGDSSYTGGTSVLNGTLQLGNGGTAGHVGPGNVAIAAGATFATNRSNTLALSNTLTGAGRLVINNAVNGVTNLSSITNSYSGGTQVNSGTLMVTNASGSATGTGGLLVAAGAFLTGDGRIAPAAGNSIIIQGSLVIGQSSLAAADLELVTTGAGLVLMDGVSSLVFDLVGGAGGGDTTGSLLSDRLLVGGNFTINPSSALTVLNPNGMTAWAGGDKWRLFDWATLGGTASGTFASVTLPSLGTTSLQWDTSSLYSDGTIMVMVVAVPEPQKAMLILLGLIMLYVRRRRA